MIENLKFTKLDKCLCCGSKNLQLVLDLKDQPLANSYCNSIYDIEDNYPLALNYCTDCTHLQLTVGVNPDLLFKNYLYVSGTTQTLRDYFDKFVDIVTDYMTYSGPYKVLDIACNDGSQLNAFKNKNHMTYGIDPAKNLYEISSKNHKIICDYFTNDSVKELGAGKFDIIVAQNVFAHNTYPIEFLKVCRDNLSDKGKIFVQTSQADMVEYGQFDTIYHEHISFFNTRSMSYLAKNASVYLEDVFKTDIHGTSYVFVFTKDSTMDNSVKLVNKEKEQTLQIANDFANKAVTVVSSLQEQLNKFDDCYIVGYGAAAKGNTLLNFGEIDLDYIVDDNPLKHGLYTPGRKIKIISLDQMIKIAEGRKIVWVPLSWNFFNEIKARVQTKYKNSTTFIKYFPTLEIINA